MRQPPAHVSRGRLAVAWTIALLAAGAALVTGSPASAHDVLVATDPADGATLTDAPTQVVLTFAAEQAGVGAEVVVTGPDGASWSEGEATVSGVTVTQALRSGMPDGAYTVAWRSVAQDGHPVTGAFGFSLAAGDEAPAGEDPAADDTSGEDAPSDSAPTQAGSEPSPEATLAAEQETSDRSGWGVWPAAWAALALVALATAVVVLVRRRGSRG
ncbi:copper resistance CopC family protein [Actinotalea fermentans]|uniref:Copper resistance protein n=1 Tax=Actinotalea fermentans TaxID=43671 RepID=A0A511YTK9_9CELL|nr:copper resistance CopC family protein [Actinotalea fermentans]KGM16127.1 hypothetical protein N867_02820 [Actinotalea fermentans ATCC 43279 = JCM 9966 = DSM 3133]GEN78524.1 copper resistance protein [Actinotalea fermentans]